MKKKLISLFCIIALTSSIVACGNSNPSKPSVEDEQATEVGTTVADVKEDEAETDFEEEVSEEEVTEEATVSSESNQTDTGSAAKENEAESEPDYDANVFEKAPSTDIQFFDIPEGTTKIGYNAFAGCSNLDTVTIPDSVKVIDGNAFSGCEALKEIKLPEGLVRIENHAFSGAGIERIHIPDSVEYIGQGAFSSCKNLKDANIPSGACLIDEKNKHSNAVFSYCESLENVSLPDDLEFIPAAMFAECRNRSSIQIPDSVKVIEQKAFSCCESLSDFAMPSSLTEIESCAFECCAKDSDTVELTLPNTTKTIKDGAFQFCNAIITLPPSITKLGNNPFSEVKELKVPQSLLDSLHVREDGFADAYGQGVKVTVYTPDITDVPDDTPTASQEEDGIVGDWYPEGSNSDSQNYWTINDDGTGVSYDGNKENSFKYDFDGVTLRITWGGIGHIQETYYYDNGVLESSHGAAGTNYIKK